MRDQFWPGRHAATIAALPESEHERELQQVTEYWRDYVREHLRLIIEKRKLK